MQGQTGEDLPILNYSDPWAFEVSKSMIFIYWISDYWLLRQRQDIDRKGSNFVNHKNFWLCHHRYFIFHFLSAHRTTPIRICRICIQLSLHDAKGHVQTVQLVLESHRPENTSAETMRMRGPLLSQLDFWQPPGGLLWSATSTMILPVCPAETSLDSCLPLPDLLSRIRPDFFR